MSTAEITGSWRAWLMDQSHITDYCVYTIVDGKKLARVAKEGRPGEFEERKPWATASKLWQKARLAGGAMPVLFGDAADCRRLLYWGLLTDVHVHDGVTRFAVDRVRKLGGKHRAARIGSAQFRKEDRARLYPTVRDLRDAVVREFETRGLTRVAPDGRSVISSGRW